MTGISQGASYQLLSLQRELPHWRAPLRAVPLRFGAPTRRVPQSQPGMDAQAGLVAGNPKTMEKPLPDAPGHPGDVPAPAPPPAPPAPAAGAVPPPSSVFAFKTLLDVDCLICSDVLMEPVVGEPLAALMGGQGMLQAMPRHGDTPEPCRLPARHGASPTATSRPLLTFLPQPRCRQLRA